MEVRKISIIVDLKPKAHHRLEVILDNGSKISIEFESRLNTVRFGQLQDELFFMKAQTDGKFVRWDESIEISLNEIYQFAQK